jgi:hypothetical protein
MSHHDSARAFAYTLRQAAPAGYGLFVAEVIGAPPSLTILQIDKNNWSYNCIETKLFASDFDCVQDAYFHYMKKRRGLIRLHRDILKD